MTAKDIEVAVTGIFDIRKYLIVPNVSHGFNIHESDIIIVNNNNYITEVEIKISKSDFYRDFEKKHKHQDNRIRSFYYCMPEQIYNKVEADIPESSGIITCREISKGWIKATMLRKASLNRNARPITNNERYTLARLGAIRIWKLKREIISLRNEIKKMKCEQ